MRENPESGPHLSPEKEPVVFPAVSRGDFMNLELIGGDFYGFVDDRYGRELVDVAIDRQAHWNPSRSIIENDTLNTSVLHDNGRSRVLIHFSRTNTAGKVLEEWKMEAIPDMPDRQLWKPETGHNISRVLHHSLWRLVSGGERLDDALASRLSIGSGARLLFRASEDGSEANNEVPPPGTSL